MNRNEEVSSESDDIIRPKKVSKLLPKFGSNRNPAQPRLPMPRKVVYDEKTT